jgi:hypothetical protein
MVTPVHFLYLKINKNKCKKNKTMKKLIFTIAIAFIGNISFAQINCGWQYLYNQAGNRYARLAIHCPPPPANAKTELEETPLAEIQLEINNVYPVPTGGKFTVEFSMPLENETIKLFYNKTRSNFSLVIGAI